MSKECGCGFKRLDDVVEAVKSVLKACQIATEEGHRPRERRKRQPESAIIYDSATALIESMDDGHRRR